MQQTPATAWGVTFTDIASQSGLTHPTIYGGLERKRFIIETNGSGVALLDYDRDGLLDVLTLSGTRLQDGTRREMSFGAADAPTNRLYRNTGKGAFEDVTDRAGLRRTGWASSVCAGDYNNDGWTDVYVTYYGRNVLYRNRGDGRFADATREAGLESSGTRWGSGCAFVDLDRDGLLDLFVANYLKFDLATAPEPGSGPNCTWKGVPVNCGPKGLPTDTNLLYRNLGQGKFGDVSETSGIARVIGRWKLARRHNSRRGARRNIAEHYDLGNDFYSLWLDRSLTYSSALPAYPNEPMESAQRRISRERAIGVVYRPETELQSHYFHACLPRQFDEYVWFDETRALRPVTEADAGGFAPLHPLAS